jgi:hypothetical protein
MTLKLHIAADSLQISPLTVQGNESGSKRTLLPADTNTFVFSLDQSVDHTPWYGLDAYGKGTLAVPGMEIPMEWALEQNYPNPFNPLTVVRAEWPVASEVRLVVYDVLGQEVATLAGGRFSAGRYEFRFDARHLPSGVYFVRLTAGGFTRTRKMVLTR